jgi:hypothetical protein
MLLKVPEYDGVYGSLFEVILKQRPQAPPEERSAPNAYWLTAAVYPDVCTPHAVKGHRGQRGLHGVLNREHARQNLQGD